MSLWRVWSAGCMLFAVVGIALTGTGWAEEPGADAGIHMTPIAGTSNAPAPTASRWSVKPPPLLLAEGSNSCEIVSCGMGIKQTCQITCPADKTPKCSCDCVRNIGPMCMDYKANCRCE
jgi:hypothetical protein